MKQWSRYENEQLRASALAARDRELLRMHYEATIGHLEPTPLAMLRDIVARKIAAGESDVVEIPA